MTEELIASYGDEIAVKNVEDDLRALGIPSEKIFVDPEHRRIRVRMPEATQAEIMEVLKRHQPVEFG